MASDVYFVNLRARSDRENKVSKIQKLFENAAFKGLVSKDDLTAIKLHFGERGNEGYINPVFVRQVVDKIKAAGAKPFVTDTNTLYSGSRHNAVDHAVTAIEHGFDYAVVGAPVIIADGLMGENIKKVAINQKHFKEAKIAGSIAGADSMIVMSHFKGHEMAGFGGAIKNLAMGCAPAAGKKDQHSTRQTVNVQKCIGCGKCVEICPEAAAVVKDKKAFIDTEKCIGCGECMTVCPTKAITVDWYTEIPEFLEKMTEYAYAAIKGKENRVGYINFLVNITPDCDCASWSDAPIVPDIGILASKDPVAIDKASYDLVNAQLGFKNSLLTCNHEQGEDKFRGIREEIDGLIQINYAEEIGIGSTKYNLIEI
ncbi:MAG: DUF362 domain-containing protein [Clostridia bacterium]|nr:DUF362 domain-containing protein [Clostridia bacterium]